MKKEHLEILIKEIVKNVLENKRVVDYILEDKDPNALPDENKDIPEDDEDDEDEKTKLEKEKNRIKAFFVKSEKDILQISFDKNMSASNLERSLHLLASKYAGPRVMVHTKTLRDLQNLKTNPQSTLYLYIGKLDPEDSDDEIYLLSTKDLNYAKENAIEVETKHPSYKSSTLDPLSNDDFYTQKISTAGSIKLSPEI